MNETKLEIGDYYVLLNLHKALLEAKFHMNPDNILVCSSPIIADLSNEIVDILIKLDEIKDKNNKEKWENWRRLKNQEFYKERAVKNALLNDRWLKLDDEGKVKCTKNLLSPFKATEDEIKTFITEVNEVFCVAEEIVGNDTK
ncbi:MAG: hypothetical protein IJA10_16100 [Lachnospiraceae bacterium]|nr:hypothetical protein [Lachnospiraceae bacterium]MBQ4524442.1 hypothetical protein [Lachnospiraceae bacterium]